MQTAVAEVATTEGGSGVVAVGVVARGAVAVTAGGCGGGGAGEAVAGPAEEAATAAATNEVEDDSADEPSLRVDIDDAPTPVHNNTMALEDELLSPAQEQDKVGFLPYPELSQSPSRLFIQIFFHLIFRWTRLLH